MSRADGRRGLFLAALALVTIVAFGGTAGNDFISYDDGEYLTANPAVRQGLSLDGVVWAFTATRTGNWHPLTWISHQFDVSLFGMDPGSHHLVNLGLHALNAGLIFLALLSLTGAQWRSVAVAALFAVHPLHVESVAWAAERKDVLSTFLALAALLAYVRAVRRGRVARSTALPAFFLLALLAKPMPVSLPFVFLLLDWWPLGRWTPGGVPSADARTGRFLAALLPPARLWIEKAPLFLLAALSAAITLAVQRHGGAMDFGDSVAFARRAANVVQAYSFYLGRTVWPVDLAVFYPYPAGTPAWWAWSAQAALLAGTSCALLRWSRRRPYLGVGWLWFLGTLVPAIGLVQVGAQAWADRYTYLPLTGLFIAGSWGLGSLAAGRPRLRVPIAAAAGVLLLACLGMTRAQVSSWRDSLTLYRHAVEATDGNWLAHNNLGTILMEQGRTAEAADNFGKSLQARPDLAESWSNLGDALLAGNDVPQAVAHYRRALEIVPGLPAAHVGLGAAYERLGRTATAEEEFADALAVDPANTAAALHLARLRLRAGDGSRAAVLLEVLLRREPSQASAHTLFGEVLTAQGQQRAAEYHYREAIRLRPEDAEAHLGLGALLAVQGNLSAAAAGFSHAASLKPTLAEAHYNLGKVLDAEGKPAEAVQHYRRAIGARPAFAEAHNNLGVDLLLLGDTAAGTAHLREALRISPDYDEARVNLETAGARK